MIGIIGKTHGVASEMYPHTTAVSRNAHTLFDGSLLPSFCNASRTEPSESV